MKRLCCISVCAVVLASCSSQRTPSLPHASRLEIVEVGITVNGPGRYAARLDVSRSGQVHGGAVDDTPNPFAHEYKKELDKEKTDSIFSLAEAVLRRDSGKEPIIDRSDIVYVTIKTHDGKCHTYIRDLKGQFEIRELNELDQELKAIKIGPTVGWP